MEAIPAYGTVVALSIRSSNFGWARQAVFQKIASGRPKFGSEREVRSSPWGFSALTASRLDAPRVPKNPKGKRFSWPHRRAAHTGHTHRDERPGGPRGAGSPAPSPCCHSVAARSGPLQGQAVEALLRARQQGAVSGAERRALCGDERRSGCCKQVGGWVSARMSERASAMNAYKQ